MDTTNDDRLNERGWEGGWEEHRRAQLLRMAALPFSAKLEWLEEAQKLAKQLAEARALTR